MKKESINLPFLPLRDPDLVVFPGMLCEIDVGRAFSTEAVKKAKKRDGKLIIGMQKNSVENPKAENFYIWCIEAEIKSELPLNNKETQIRIIVAGRNRVLLKSIDTKEDCFFCEVDSILEPVVEIDDEVKDLIKQIKEMINDKVQFIVLENDFSPKNSQELSEFLDIIAAQLPVSGKQRVEILGTLDPRDRLDLVVSALADVAENVEMEITSEPSEYAENDNNISNEIKQLKQDIEESGMPDNVLKVAKNDLKRLSLMSPSNSEFQVIYNYLENLSSLPWDKTTEDKIDIDEARKILDEDHYGLKKAKERILEFLAVKKLKPENKGPILCFLGSPGVGKTSSGKSIAKATGRKFIRMSLGGVGDEAEIRGHRRTYVGAMLGRIMENIKKAGSKNPVFMLDEIDKLCSNFRGDPASALLEVLDPEQNNSFTDHYLNVPFDLSQVLFIGTVNETSTISPALRDRLEIIEFPGYSPSDKIKIAQNYLVPKQLKENGLEDKDITFSTKAIGRIVEEYTSEAGVRSLERECGTIMRKLAVMVASEKETPKIIKIDMVPKHLGPPKTFSERAVDKPEIGLSTGLAWSRHGGSILFIETSLTPGDGKIHKPTGNLGKVIQESVNAAHTWIHANANELGISSEFFKKHDIHIHFPAGAIPKDGPSAGIAIATSMLSAFTNRPVRNDTAMTGEITLRGRVLPIGGLKEKILAAHRAGIKHVIFPEKNKHDIEEIPTDVANDMKFTKVKNVKEALDLLLLKKDFSNNPSDINTGSNEELINISCA